VLVSATLSTDVLDMTTKFMNDPIRILVKRDELTLEGIKQFFVAVEKEVVFIPSSCSFLPSSSFSHSLIRYSHTSG